MNEIERLAHDATVPDSVFRAVCRMVAFSKGRAVFTFSRAQARGLADRVKMPATERRLREACEAAGWVIAFDGSADVFVVTRPPVAAARTA